MLGPHFYNEAIRKTVIAFGTLFNNIEHRKFDAAGNVLEAEKVPLAYGPQSKFLTRLEQNPSVDKKVAITLPRLYFEMSGINYDSSRKIAPTQKYRTVIQDSKEVRVQYVPVPYNMEFELGIIAKSQDTGLQILEQILPYFQPNFNITLNMIPDMNEKKDISVILNSINYADDWDDNFLDRRSIVWTLMFTAKSYIYGPFNKADVIKKAIVYQSPNSKGVAERSTKMSYTPKALKDYDSDATTTTTADHTEVITTITVSDSSNLAVDDRIVIDSEIMKITSVIDATSVRVKRHWDSTTAATHTTGATVNKLTTADDDLVISTDDFGFNEGIEML